MDDPGESVMNVPNDFDAFLAAFKSTKFKDLLPSQRYVLAEYRNQFVQHADVAIELPTGAGKTLIALLIAEVWRREGHAVAVLSANKTLARQMRSEAEELGIPVVLMQGRGTEIANKDKRAFQRAQAVAVMNYWVYFNQNPSIDPADLSRWSKVFAPMQPAHSYP